LRPEVNIFRLVDGGPAGGHRSSVTPSPALHSSRWSNPSKKDIRPRATRVESGLRPNLRQGKNAAAVLLQPLQGAARGLIPIDCAAIWYQLVDLKTVTRRAVLRLLRLALAFTCDPCRAE
jgi:hypothetical protein